METFDAGRALADLLTVRRVFGEPVVRDDVTVIPVARVVGGGGGGSVSLTATNRDSGAAGDGPLGGSRSSSATARP